MPNVKSHAERLAKITEWLGKNSEEFYEAIGAWEGDEQIMVLLLSQIPKYLAGRYPMYKDDMAERRDRTIASFLKGESVSNEELRTAIALLMQSLGGAVNRLAARERQDQRDKQNRFGGKRSLPGHYRC
jgi:hypothetical protein